MSDQELQAMKDIIGMICMVLIVWAVLRHS